MTCKRRVSLPAFARRFGRDTAGTAMTEALLVVPLLTLMAIAILEFGLLFLERQAVQTGVRDAGRYLARCKPESARCSIDIARNIAFHGTLDGSGPARLRGWTGANGLVLLSALPPADGILRVEGRFDHAGTPLMHLLGLPTLSIHLPHAERWMGW